ncbi:hypothetical protein P691DRAFT_807693 [Macrolepiota fuliginosa MF-IS2]|uniref:Uncharacterized protein n=1 Tax=Macrolepiota fuliginosa MF-IS2 TaxID=1400762 RepID=A0A9P6BYH1_9AGAR|nr:hypothetical protein P691DRAFT_807693 [Macrolepiota fuliginosa MF-IS2]
MKFTLSALGIKLRELLTGHGKTPKPDEGKSWKPRGPSDTGGGTENGQAKPVIARPSDVGSTTSSNRRPVEGASGTNNKKKTSDDKKKTSKSGMLSNILRKGKDEQNESQ